MIRRSSSLIEEAKLVTQENRAKRPDVTGNERIVNRHEILIYPTDGWNKITPSFVMKCLEDCGASLRVVEVKSTACHENSPENQQSKKMYVECECSFEDLLAVEQKITECNWAVIKRLSSLGGVSGFRHADLDFCQHLKQKVEDDPITAAHPGYQDNEYVERRRKITEIALSYQDGEPIPCVDYAKEEIETWKKVYLTLKPLHASGACAQYQKAFDELESCGLYNENIIPQLDDVSKHLLSRTGFRLRPVGGLVSPRDFLASLAVKVFQCTQYIRHHLSPMHTPEPDCCHELLGHVPMLLDTEFARFSQEIGILSLGACDEDIEKLASLYWFTVEFGLCRQDGEIKAYGAGILSAYGELEHALSGIPVLVDFDAEKASVQPYQDNVYQPLYFVASSFKSAVTKIREFASKSFSKPFNARYDSSTGTIEIFRKHNPHDVAKAVEQLKIHVDLIKDLVE